MANEVAGGLEILAADPRDDVCFRPDPNYRHGSLDEEKTVGSQKYLKLSEQFIPGDAQLLEHASQLGRDYACEFGSGGHNRLLIQGSKNASCPDRVGPAQLLRGLEFDQQLRHAG